MPKELPFVSCLCPTYYRPQLLPNAVQCFIDQIYPSDRKELIILDDAGQIEPLEYRTSGGIVKVISTDSRYETLPHKFNELACLAQGDIYAVWEDDDVYLPHHLKANVEMIVNSGFSPEEPQCSKWSRVISCYRGKVFSEPSTGRFHASLVFNQAALEVSGGWPITKRADFDQQFIAKLHEVCGGFLDPLTINELPQYALRWEGSKSFHGQNTMRSPDDETWYDRIPELIASQGVSTAKVDGLIQPRYDADTLSLLQLIEFPHVYSELVNYTRT
mgnify:CR=1 FL=1